MVAAGTGDATVIEKPVSSDGAALWRLARDSGKLDLNSSYAYLLWCHDFADTTVVARSGGEPVGFITGYRRPTAPDTVVVWQVAVDQSQRGKGLAGRMLDTLFDTAVAEGVRFLETTVTPDNEASLAMFRSFAKRWNTDIERSDHFEAGDFPDEHEQEDLYRIGPLTARG